MHAAIARSLTLTTLNRLVSKTMPNGGTETYAYDAAGRQIAKTDAKGQKIQYAYDSTGRLTGRIYPDGTTVEFAYTSTGKRDTVKDTRGTTSYRYDDRDRMNKHTYPDEKAIDYTYDKNGRISTLSSFASTVTYSYSASGRLKDVTDPQESVTSYNYDDAGNRTGLAYPNGTAVSYVYDNNNRLTQLTHQNSVGEILASYAYTLGAIGNRTRIDESNGISRKYDYDDLYRLTKEQVTDPANAQTYKNDYSYDAVANRLNKTYTAYNQPAASNDYAYNNADQLLTENGIAYTYDLNGNLASKTDSIGTTTYTYDYENRLVKVSAPAVITEYQYDTDGNRVSASTAAGMIKYLVDTNKALVQVLAEYTAGGSILAFYVYADDLISITRSGNATYYHFDGLGSTRLLTDGSGIVTDSYQYDAFGNLITDAGSTENHFLFTGQQYDANIKFYYLRARYYQPATGRFASVDPYRGEPYTPATLHRYLYAANDPVNNIDPTGNFVETIATVQMLAQTQQLTYNENFHLQGYKSNYEYDGQLKYSTLSDLKKSKTAGPAYSQFEVKLTSECVKREHKKYQANFRIMMLGASIGPGIYGSSSFKMRASQLFGPPDFNRMVGAAYLIGMTLSVYKGWTGGVLMMGPSGRSDITDFSGAVDPNSWDASASVLVGESIMVGNPFSFNCN